MKETDSRNNEISNRMDSSYSYSKSSRSNYYDDYSHDNQQQRNTHANPNDEESKELIIVRGHGPDRRAGHTATAVNRYIYIFGGSCGSDYLNDFFVLDTGKY